MADLVQPTEKYPGVDGTPGFRPAMTPPLLWRDVGSSGLRQWSGWVREEFLRALQGREGARVYREMRDNSPTIGALMFAIAQTMRRIDWREEGASDAAGQSKHTDFARSLRFDMSHSWEEFIAEALSMLEFGFAPHEVVYKRRTGKRQSAAYSSTGATIGGNLRDEASSKHDDGMIGIRRLPLRGQETILRWYFDPNGQVTGLQQQPWQGPLIDIPIEKLLLFRPLSYKGNPEGRSILRNSYRPYFFTKRIEEEEAILFERLNGLPVCYVPQQILDTALLPGPEGVKAAATLEYYKKLVTNVRIDEQMGVILPSNTYEGVNGPSNVKMYEFSLLTPSGGGGARVDSDKVLHRYSLDMLKTAMADFIDLGHQARGTQNLAVSKVDMFFQAITGWLQSMASVLNRYMLPRVWDLNGWSVDDVPQYVPDLAQRVDLNAVGSFILRMAQAGARLFPDDDLENFLRDTAGMPALDDSADYKPLQELVNPASQIVKPSPVEGTPTGGAGAGAPLGKVDRTAGSQVADAVLYEIARELRKRRPPYAVQGERAAPRKRTVKAKVTREAA